MMHGNVFTGAFQYVISTADVCYFPSVQNGGEQRTRTLVLGQRFSHRSWEFHRCLHLLHRITILPRSTPEPQEKAVGAVQRKVMAKVV